MLIVMNYIIMLLHLCVCILETTVSEPKIV